jgi:hypothetical protein
MSHPLEVAAHTPTQHTYTPEALHLCWHSHLHCQRAKGMSIFTRKLSFIKLCWELLCSKRLSCRSEWASGPRRACHRRASAGRGGPLPAGRGDPRLWLQGARLRYIHRLYIAICLYISARCERMAQGRDPNHVRALSTHAVLRGVYET